MTEPNDSNEKSGSTSPKIGRPPKYREEFCERVLELGLLGHSKAVMAAELDVSRVHLDKWCERHPAFGYAMTRARELSLAWWERQGRDGITNKNFNANAYRLQVMNRFPKDWRDTREIQLKGSLSDLDMSKLPQACVRRIAAGENALQVLAEYADWALNPPAEQRALPAGDGEVGEG